MVWRKSSRCHLKSGNENALKHTYRFCPVVSGVRDSFGGRELGKTAVAMKSAIARRAAMASDTGLERSVNEDRVYIDEERGVFLVVDGVGGHSAGEKAAEMAAAIIPRQLELLEGSVDERVRRAITVANNEIYQISQQSDECRGMACVLTLAVAHEDKITVGHIGDSRLYLVWDGALKKVTSDHSPVGEREDQGELTEFEAMAHPRRNEVFRDVGSRPHEPDDEEFIEIKSLPFHSEAAILLCSDGLSDALTSSDIGAIVERYDGDPDRLAQTLVDAANAAGGKDNVSVIFVAGPEFGASGVMENARTRHAITRMREDAEPWRRWLGRVAWLVAGMILGAIAWSVVERTIGRTTPGPRSDNAARITHYSVDAADPHGIAKALSTARPGDTIDIPRGEYLGPIYLKDGVVLTSRNVGGAVVRADPAAAADAGVAFMAQGIGNARLSGVRVVSDRDHPLKIGLLVRDSDIEVDENEISGAADAGVVIAGKSGSSLRANLIHDNPGSGVRIEQGAAPTLTGNRISDNGRQPGSPKPAIDIRPPANPKLMYNLIEGNGADTPALVTPRPVTPERNSGR